MIFNYVNPILYSHRFIYRIHVQLINFLMSIYVGFCCFLNCNLDFTVFMLHEGTFLFSSRHALSR